ncbi:PREDICTED: coiled-coil domain-containing protein 73-like [Amphimedon queenslandica]|uniref:Uncharacterized protein n=1 Tax=Amphimedon queenslandica TaxID=400682 RepID=A0AAN0JFR8_AMPQE|nr:PREDICTED: coiled-coil domain-containing protein 73-like [Amphimedon queenslandica]|eukprot:XP_019855885.1 PREDICTED: coiled-coil domain-containing protein 73-like [Amphimedon queenslandica]
MTEDVSLGYSSSLPTDEAGVSDVDPTAGKVLESSSAAVSLFTECRMMKYRNKFFELIEELRLRRDVNDQNEKKLCELLFLKHKLTQDIEKQTQQLNEVLESHSHLEEETERKCNEQLKQLEEEKVKLKCLFEGKEKEFQALKDEIRALHMIKYNLEKKLSEQEYTLQVLNVSQENYHSQLSQMEQQCVDMEAKVNEVTKLLETLESNVREAVELNGRLATANDHQQCVVDSYKEELDTYQKDCIKLKVSIIK